MTHYARALALFLLLSSLSACAGTQRSHQAPELSSSTQNPHYALEYPSRLAKLAEHLSARENDARQTIKTLPDIVQALPGDNPELLQHIIETAAQDGQTTHVDRRAREIDTVTRFSERTSANMASGISVQVRQFLKKNHKECADAKLPYLQSEIKRHGVGRLVKELQESTNAAQMLRQTPKKLSPAKRRKALKALGAITLTSHYVHAQRNALLEEYNTLKADLEDVESTVKDLKTKATEDTQNPKATHKDKKKARETLKTIKAWEKSLQETNQKTQTLEQLLNKNKPEDVEDSTTHLQSLFQQSLQKTLDSVAPK